MKSQIWETSASSQGKYLPWVKWEILLLALVCDSPVTYKRGAPSPVTSYFPILGIISTTTLRTEKPLFREWGKSTLRGTSRWYNFYFIYQHCYFLASAAFQRSRSRVFLCPDIDSLYLYANCGIIFLKLLRLSPRTLKIFISLFLKHSSGIILSCMASAGNLKKGIILNTVSCSSSV